MKATNLTLSPVELDPVNGPGMLGPAVDGSEDFERELVDLTDRERDLEAAGVIALSGDAPQDRYDKMDGDALEAEATKRASADENFTVERSDGRTDRPPTQEDYRRALRLHDAEGGAA